jgi:hypothetical protein
MPLGEWITTMKTRIFLAGAALAAAALPQLAFAQSSNGGIDNGKPLQIEPEPNTLAPSVTPPPVLATPETRATRKAARSRISVRPRVRTARRRGE